MEVLHILPYRLQILFRTNGEFCFCTSIRQPDTVVAGICNQFKVVSDDENRLFLPHFPDQCSAPLQTFRVLSCCRFVQYDDGLVGQIRHHQRQTLHLPAGEGEGVPVAALPHIHAFQQRFRFCFKLRCHRMAVLQLVQDGAGEELELRLLQDEQYLLLQLLWVLRLSEKRYPASGGAVKSCNQLADRRFAAAVCATRPTISCSWTEKLTPERVSPTLLPYV